MTQTLTAGKKTRTVKSASSKANADGVSKTAGKTTAVAPRGRSGLNVKYALAGVGADVAKVVSKVGRPVWAEVSTSALTYNLDAIRKFVNPENEMRQTPRLVLSIVKGNGYGHGGPQVAKILEKAGSDWFGVTSAAEGIEVRKAGVKKPILVLTSFWPGEEKNLLKYDLTPVVHRIEQLAQLNRAAAKDDKRDPLSFHLKIDSGMNRLGIASNEVDEFAAQLAKCQSLRLGGVMTHFASSEAFSTSAVGAQTREQEEHFFVALERLRALGVDPGIVHLANSAAIASRPETWGDMVRPGVILYGYHPGYDPQEKREEAEKQLPLKPAMSLRTRIINLRRIPAGSGVGYGMKFVATRPSVIAVLAAGYGDGVHRSLGTKGTVLVRGKSAPIVGIVSMDVTMIDVTDVNGVEIGDVVTIYGTDGENLLAANVVARGIGTVTSDLLCAVTARVPRVYRE
ncbi:MAG TPA: alanine racemase [Candidatus Acidoferrum sp.]|jgi:alanine racemase